MDASAIPNVGAHIYQHLWEAGYGSIDISQSGPLDRSLIDASVWQPERVDFAAEPVLEGDVIRRAPNPVLLNGARELATAVLEQLVQEAKLNATATVWSNKILCSGR